LARIYQGLAYDQIKNYHKAHETFAKLKREKINKIIRNFKHLLRRIFWMQEKRRSSKRIDNAYELNSNRKLKSRIAYLRGQVLENLGQNDKARESFLAAYKYANDFEFEVKSQIAIAKLSMEKEITMVPKIS
jgi:tetratricopeptide (TPR) repeat protein